MKQRKIYIDMLNIIACFCVICMHCNGIVHRYSNSAEWKQSMIVETIAYWAVPVFFMMSGATLMNYGERYDTKTYLKKRFLRVGIPFNSSLSFPMTGGYVLYAILGYVLSTEDMSKKQSNQE